MGLLSKNYLVNKFASILSDNGYVHVSSDYLRLEYRIESKIRKYNKNAKKNCSIQISKPINEKIKRVAAISDPDYKADLDELKALLELKLYFNSNGIKENEIGKKRKEILSELKILLPKMNIGTKYNDVIYNTDDIEFINISSLSQFSSYLHSKKMIDKSIYFRGQANINWPIKPSVFRGKWIDEEHNIIREMVLRNPSEFTSALSTLDKLTKMQHYNAPTRLLDLTHNPYIALYFACEEIKDFEDTCYGEVVIFEDDGKSERYYDSDTVSIISNIAMMKNDFTDKGLPDKIDEYNKSGDIPYLLHQIEYEKMNFLPIIEKGDLHRCLIVKVKLDNKRIINQQGLFLLVGMGDTKKDPAEIQKYMKRITGKRNVFIIPSKIKKSLLSELETMNINKGLIYPEIDDVADYLKTEVFKQ